MNVGVCVMFRLDLNMELPQGQTGSVGTSVASAEQVHMRTLCLDFKIAEFATRLVEWIPTNNPDCPLVFIFLANACLCSLLSKG